MKTRILILLFIIAANAFAQLDVIVYPLSPYVEEGKEVSILVTLTNLGSNSIAIPPGLNGYDGYVIPNANVDYQVQAYKLINKVPTKTFSLGVGGGNSGMDIKLVEDALTVYTKDEIFLKLHGHRFLEFQETVTYKISWPWEYKVSRLFENDRIPIPEFKSADMFRIADMRFGDFEINIPSFRLYPKNKSNQALEPTPAGAAHR